MVETHGWGGSTTWGELDKSEKLSVPSESLGSRGRRWKAAKRNAATAPAMRLSLGRGIREIRCVRGFELCRKPAHHLLGSINDLTFTKWREDWLYAFLRVYV